MSGSGARLPGVYPPSLCDPRLIALVVLAAEVAWLLMLLGGLPAVDGAIAAWGLLWAAVLALLCAGGACLARAWLARSTPRNAWLGSWLLAVVVALAMSYFVAVVGTVLQIGPSLLPASQFVTVSVAAVALVAAALLRYLFVYALWQSQTVAQADARVQALQSRIRPHFLFNSLNTIASLVPEDPVAAERAIEDLADIFRGGMQRADQPIPLGQELRLARQYLAMEQRRIGDRLAVSWDDAELPADAMVLPLTLQPLLENAIRHGIQSGPGPGEIALYGRIAAGEVTITVRNTVVPGGEAQHGHGMALANLEERLALAYGDRGGLLTRLEDNAFYAVLRIPHVEDSDRG